MKNKIQNASLLTINTDDFQVLDELEFDEMTDVDYNMKLILCNSYERMATFFQIENEIETDEEYWEQLACCYQSSDNNYKLRNEIKNAFTSARSGRDHLMTYDDLLYLKNLPETLTIYRGMSIDEMESGEYGISWTLDREIADFFAFKYIRNYDTQDIQKTVIELIVSKKDIIAYFSDRKEAEVIYLGKY